MTVLSSCPSAPFKSGEFCSESRSPMAETPFGLVGRFRFRLLLLEQVKPRTGLPEKDSNGLCEVTRGPVISASQSLLQAARHLDVRCLRAEILSGSVVVSL